MKFIAATFIYFICIFNLFAASDPPATAAEDIFVKAFTDKETVYVNEPVVHTFQFFTSISVNMLSRPEYRQPDFNGFLPEIAEQGSHKTSIAGKGYNVSEVKTLLFPQKAGNVIIDAGVINVNVEDTRNADFFRLFYRQGRNLAFETDPITLKVLPLPENVSMNGEYEITARTDAETYKTNEPFNLIVAVTGNGNVRVIPTPPVKVSKNLKLYETSSETSSGKTISQYSAGREFTTLILPAAPGEAAISIEPLKYFDPDTKTVKQLKVEDIVFTIEGEAKTPVQNIAPQYVEQTVISHGADTMTYSINLGSFSKIFDFLKKNLVWLGAALLVLIIIKMYSIHIERLNKDVVKLKSKEAYRRYGKYFQNAKKAKNAKDFYGAMYKGILEYFAGVFNQSAGGLTTSRIKNMMTEAGEDAQTVSEIENILNECQAMLYSNAKITSDASTKDFYNKAFNVLNRLHIHGRP